MFGKYIPTIEHIQKLMYTSNYIEIKGNDKLVNVKRKIMHYEKQKVKYKLNINFSSDDSSLNYKIGVMNMIDKLGVGYKVGILSLEYESGSNPINE